MRTFKRVGALFLWGGIVLTVKAAARLVSLSNPSFWKEICVCGEDSKKERKFEKNMKKYLFEIRSQ